MIKSKGILLNNATLFFHTYIQILIYSTMLTPFMDSSNTIVSINTLALALRHRSVNVHSNTIPHATIQCISQ